jgi:hypothetical protein
MEKLAKLFVIALLSFAGTTRILATTWDEPWADSVIIQADYFVLADILSFDEKEGVKIRIIKQLGGESLPPEIEITDFYLLRLTSISGGHGAEFYFGGVDKSYFFIKKNDEGKYCISTPTSGFDYMLDGKVCAAYRHTYHQALVPVDVYEMSMTAIFNYHHDIPYDEESIRGFVRDNLSKNPAGFDEDEIDTFFLQHVALELVFHLRLDGFYDRVLPFFSDSENFHHRVSASRALVAYNTDETVDLLLKKVATNKDDDFVTVICIWTLREFKPSKKKKELKRLVKNSSREITGFGGNIMDPRVGTSFPTVNGALEGLISTL